MGKLRSRQKDIGRNEIKQHERGRKVNHARWALGNEIKDLEKKEYTAFLSFLFLFERGWIASGLNPAFGQNREGWGGQTERIWTNEKVEIK